MSGSESLKTCNLDWEKGEEKVMSSLFCFLKGTGDKERDPEIHLLIFFFFREREEGEREKETSICCSSYFCIHWLILLCALTRDQTHNLGVLGRRSNQMSYPARAKGVIERNSCLLYTSDAADEVY